MGFRLAVPASIEMVGAKGYEMLLNPVLEGISK